MILETIRMAFKSLGANKLRTILSMLGIVIGVGAVLAIISIGSGVRVKVTGQISDLGSNLITIRPQAERDASGRIALKAPDLFTLQVAEYMKANCPAIKSVVPSAQSGGIFAYGSHSAQATLEGVEPVYEELNNYHIAQGQFITKDALDGAQNVMVLGKQLANDLFGDANPLGKLVEFRMQKTTYLFTVVGLMEEKDAGIMGDFNSKAYIPVTTYLKKITNSQYVDSFIAQAASANTASAAVGQIEYFLQKYFGKEQDFRIVSQDQILGVVTDVSNTLSLMLGGIAAISLLVGGIGIMNIMLVSVTERTREIGIRKALGAKNKHILSQFVIESLSLSGFGGMIGVVLGWLGAFGISRVGDWPLTVTNFSVLIALGFAMLIGLFFGIYPALKAARLDPVQALSYE